ncbi:MAG: enoyl-CoA hydratase-related protein [Alphaproteobacteria bacterium]|jgi:enoyl-CoA hydratase|nr:enoyl-CoA hydratase [Rhodospirillaceae bacterium]MDG2481559.1 enoyl-CoA hydratase-related protein [Alphaproteobacteria bacterium]MBT6206323.1 enoyl-CoA hydratase [Rhodospirillaceae bacterium]MBT6509422.1 enoyl-CoA hydratase [Rhodospirillaceae bacterium]MBT7612481.1 enoyl-CoA hydratase [Rhodospirillaceae bacterium]
MEPQVKRENSGGVAHVVLQRPEKLNALSRNLIEDLTATFVELAADEDARCVVLSGAGRAFSAGADVAELNGLNVDNAEEFIRLLHGACQAVRDCPVPVIAKIDGPCLGGALELAASCDMRAASERSSFAMPEVQIGIPSVIEAALLPRLMGWGRACEFLYTGKSLTADEALQAGLVEKVTSSARLDDAVMVWTAAILKAGPRAIRAQKTLMRRWESSFVDEAIEAGVDAFREAHGTDEPSTKLHEVLSRRGN